MKKTTPFPTKQQILDFIKDNPDKGTKREIARAFHIHGDDRRGLKKLLREMALEGDVDKGHKGRLHGAGDLPPVTVLNIIGLDENGDLKAAPAKWPNKKKPPQIFIPHERAAGLSLGNTVLARLEATDQNNTYRAIVIRKLERSATMFLGLFQKDEDGNATIIPTDKKNRNRFAVGPRDQNGAEPGELVLAEAKAAGARRANGLKPAVVKECLGDLNQPKAISLIAIHEHSLPFEFNEDTLAEAHAAKPAPLGKRDDLRDIPLITIDPADARDHDDAIWAEPDTDPNNKGGWHVIVAIADVALYVTPGSALNNEAYRRGNSVYFPDRVVPMLPEALSNDLCSLKEGVDRACMAVHMWFDAKGHKIRHRFVRGLMRCAAGLSYEQFQAAADGHPDEKSAPLLDTIIKPLFQAYTVLDKGRQHRQPLALELPERRIRLDDAGKVVSIEQKTPLAAHKLVEEFMIQANVCAAESLEAKEWPCMYRVHEEPAAEKIVALHEFLESLDYQMAKAQVMKPSVFNTILAQAVESPHAHVINQVILRTQSQAVYTPENLGHFGLSLSRYAHFTSPIRRYADVMVHRALISAYNLGDDGLSEKDKEKFRSTAEHISKTERIAMVAERESKDRYIAAFMSEHVGEIFEGKISGVNRFGLFITLNESGGDGLVPIAHLPYDYYNHVEERHALVGEKTNLTFQLGQTVSVRLMESNPVTGGLILELCLGEDMKPEGKGPFQARRPANPRRDKRPRPKGDGRDAPKRQRKYRKK